MSTHTLSQKISNYKTECTGLSTELSNFNNLKCAIKKSYIKTDILIFDIDRKLEYNSCLTEANECKYIACSSIFNHLTQMPSCLALERRCIDNAKKNLDLVADLFNKYNEL